ncbi:MAG: tetratricopeptide repeat protein [Vicinamibacteria bacterium]
MVKRCVALGVGVLLAAAAVSAQMGTGRVTGTVKDPQGKPIAGAKITATTTENDRALETTSGDDGKWALLGFRSGTYEFTFAADGYQPQAYTNSIKQMNRNPSMDVTLEPLQMGQSAGGGGGKIEEANALLEQKQYPQAIAKFEELLAVEPTLYQVHYGIGIAQREMGELDKAMASFQKVLEREPTHTSSLIAVGDVLVAQQKLDEAVTYFEKAIVQTTDEVIPFNVAEIYFNQGNTAKALEYYQTAAERKPDWAEPHLKMGYANLNAGNIDAAVMSFQRVVEIAPESPQAQMAQAALKSLGK